MQMVKEYVNASTMQFRDALDVVEEFSKEISEMEGNCIDIGCGPGDVTRKLILPRLTSTAHLVGADISKAMVEYATEEYRKESRLSFIQLDIETDSLPNDQVGRYSNAFSFYCLHWCNNPRQAFENIYKLLKPGGKALLMFLGWNDGFDAYDRIPKNPRYEAYKEYMQDAERFIPYFHRCEASRAAFKKVLEDIGFEVLHCSRREKSYVFEDMQHFKDHILAVNPFLSRIPDYLREEFENMILQETSSKKISFAQKTDNGQLVKSILDRYFLLLAYIQKPLTTY